MENAWLILALLVIPAGYVVFELHAFNDKLKWCEHNLSKLKSQVSAEEKKNEHFLNTISKLEKQIEDLRTESKSHMDREKSKSEDLQKELLRLDLQMKDSARDLISTLNEEKKKTEDLQKEINRLQNKQEVTKIKIEKTETDVKTRDDVLKDLDDKASSLHDALQNTVEEMQKLVRHVTKMDKEMHNLRTGKNQSYKSVVYISLRCRISICLNICSILEIIIFYCKGKNYKTLLCRLDKVPYQNVFHYRFSEQRAFRDEYSGGNLILNSIRAGLSFVVSKLLEFATGGLLSVRLLN